MKLVRIGRSASGWYVAFVCDLGAAPEKIAVRNAIGIDVGLEAFATLSNGERVENPRYGRDGAAVLAMRQQRVSRRRKGSKSRQMAKVLVGRAHEAIRNRRVDHARKVAKEIVGRFDLIAHEDLVISRMVHGNLAKSIYDASWGLFLRCLASKAEEAGKHVIAVDPRGTSQQCSQCGTVVKKTLSDREHRCGCGCVLGRDHNAALNIIARGLRVGQLTEARTSP